MTTFLGPDEVTNVDLAKSRQHDRGRVACFLHLRDLVLHPGAASASAVAFVQKLEAAVIAEKAAHEKRLADVREREADRQKAAAEREKAEQAKAQATRI
jgi:hypothetical protein